MGETFRSRVGGGLPRMLKEDFRVDFVDKNGESDYYILPKGCSVGFNSAFAARTEFKNGTEWNLQNYLNEKQEFVKSKKDYDDKFKLGVFGCGKRNCPGISLARKEIMFATSILIYKYEFCGAKGKGDTDFVIPKGLLLGGDAIATSPRVSIKVIKRKNRILNIILRQCILSKSRARKWL